MTLPHRIASVCCVILSCLFVYLFACLFVCLFVYLFDCLSIGTSLQTEQQVCNGKVYNVDVIQNEKTERNIGNTLDKTVPFEYHGY